MAATVIRTITAVIVTLFIISFFNFFIITLYSYTLFVPTKVHKKHEFSLI